MQDLGQAVGQHANSLRRETAVGEIEVSGIEAGGVADFGKEVIAIQKIQSGMGGGEVVLAKQFLRRRPH